MITIIVSTAPYGAEGCWNALRLADALLNQKESVSLFLLADAVSMVKKGQKTPKGYYNLGELIQGIIGRGASVKACLTCLNARAIQQEEFVDGVEVGVMTELARWVKESDRVVSF